MRAEWWLCLSEREINSLHLVCNPHLLHMMSQHTTRQQPTHQTAHACLSTRHVNSQHIRRRMLATTRKTSPSAANVYSTVLRGLRRRPAVGAERRLHGTKSNRAHDAAQPSRRGYRGRHARQARTSSGANTNGILTG
jgi:hypothetical protein